MATLTCPKCGARYKVTDAQLRQLTKIKCQRCQDVFRLPAALKQPDSQHTPLTNSREAENKRATASAELPIGTTLRYRYRIDQVVGKTSAGVTYKAMDVKTEQPVIVKQLTFSRLKEWKTFDLFERQAAILERLDHPRIPKYYEYFWDQTETDQLFFLVQADVAGKSLQQLVTDGWRGSEAEILDIFLQIVEILDYLHHLDPPVLHRDIHPQNIVMAPDKQVYLVDFGAVRETVRTTMLAGTTVVGTFGYIPFEQFSGYASPASDFYAAGATLLYLLTHRDPADFPVENLQLQFHSAVTASPRVIRLLDGLLAYDPEQRIASAQQVRAVLAGETEQPPKQFKPSGARITRPQPNIWKIEQRRHSSAVTRATYMVAAGVLLGTLTFFFFAALPFWLSPFKLLFVYHDFENFISDFTVMCFVSLVMGVCGWLGWNALKHSVLDREKPVLLRLTPQQLQILSRQKTDALPADSLRSMAVSTEADAQGYPRSQITFYPSLEAEPLQLSLKISPEERDRLANEFNTCYAALFSKPLPIDVFG